jgi:hypothetical protein
MFTTTSPIALTLSISVKNFDLQCKEDNKGKIETNYFNLFIITTSVTCNITRTSGNNYKQCTFVANFRIYQF